MDRAKLKCFRQKKYGKHICKVKMKREPFGDHGTIIRLKIRTQHSGTLVVVLNTALHPRLDTITVVVYTIQKGSINSSQSGSGGHDLKACQHD
jgi:hypothetical protein